MVKVDDSASFGCCHRLRAAFENAFTSLTLTLTVIWFAFLFYFCTLEASHVGQSIYKSTTSRQIQWPVDVEQGPSPSHGVSFANREGTSGPKSTGMPAIMVFCRVYY